MNRAASDARSCGGTPNSASPSQSGVIRLCPPGWTPTERATLLFVIEPGRILLIEKKRGLGAGKVNAPGGRLEHGESLAEAAVREVREEIGITPLDPVHAAHLWFDFSDGYRLECAVFRASRYEGLLVETDEARPFWQALNDIPYERMWEDDRYWLPDLISGKNVAGWFVFDGERMIEKRIIERPPAARFPD